MAKAKNKYDGTGIHKRAIMHMIGQSVDVFKSEPTTADIAAWMQLSKPTARKHLKKMAIDGELIMSEVPYRANAVKHTWRLSKYREEDYMRDLLKLDYQFYASRVMKLIVL
jgi:predicted ArsR family transcriptional regulator